MKQIKLFSLIIVMGWGALLTIFLTHNITGSKVVAFCQSYRFIIEIINIALAYKIYLDTKLDKTKIGTYILFATIGLFLLNILYFIRFSLPHTFVSTAIFYSTKTLHTTTLFYNFGKIIYHVGIIILFARPLFIYVFRPKQIIVFTIVGALIDIIIFKIFSVNFHYVFSYYFYFFASLFLIRVFLDLIIFNITIILLIYSRNLGASLIASGATIITAANFMTISCHITQINVLLNYAELLWVIGVTILTFGIITILKNRTYNVKLWFKTNASITSKLILWSVGISFLSIILFFVIVDKFSVIDKKFFVFSPTIIMCYTLIVAVFSILIGNAFEQPFKQIQTNIESMLVNDTKNINANFTIDEFTFLQKHLVNTLKIKEEKDKVKKMFGETAAATAHDIASPINAMVTAITHLKKQMVDANDISLLEASMQSVRDISKNLLISYESLDGHNIKNNAQSEASKDDSNTTRYIVLSELIENIIVSKRIEWQNVPCNITYKIDLPNIQSSAYVSPLEMSRAISNLLNNAYESLNKVKRNILLTLSIVEKSFVLRIKDNGSGIPSDKINAVLTGTSLKHSGHGLGLSSARKYFETLGGKLMLESTLNQGTTVCITLPIAISHIIEE